MKYLISLIATVVIFIAIVGAYFYPKFTFTPGAVSTSSSTVFNTAKVAETGFNPTTATATTSTSLLNTDTTDRVITDAFAYCSSVGTSLTYLTGAPLANLIFTLGTTTNTADSNPATANNKFTMTVATTTVNSYVSTTTTPFPDNGTRLWASGTYLQINANATNTASCITGVHYLAS